MNPTWLSPSKTLSSHPLPTLSRSGFDCPKKCCSRTRIVASTGSSGANDENYHCSGRLVDENMIVLRKRIHEMKMVERKCEPPSDWFDWEKRCYASYDSMIYEFIAFLQLQLMDTRPCLALGALTLIILSVPTSLAMIFIHFVDIAKNLT